jgi:PAS domain-containing protein
MTQRRHFNPDHKRNNATRQKSDVRERKQTDEPLAWEILNSSANLIFLKDTEGRYLFVNRQFERTFRTRQERIEGKRDDEIFPSQQAAAFRANDLRVLEAGVPMEFEEATVQDDGPHTSIVQRFPLINAEGARTSPSASGRSRSSVTARSTTASSGKQQRTR